MKKTIILLSSVAALSGCMMSNAETRALAQGAISDIRSKPKEVHLAFLQCYAIKEKDNCQHIVERDYNLEDIRDSSSWEYVRPYRYEAERLGFVQFLRDNGRTCKGVDQGPQYNNETQAYDVSCIDGRTYKMRFHYKDVEHRGTRSSYRKGQWHIVE